MRTAVSTLPDALTVHSSYCWTFPLTTRPVPAVTASRGAAVRFAGTLFDRTALARELGAPAAENPADLVARACERWGAGAVEHLRGAFAVAIDDQRRGELIVARDHAGLCPVFYATHGGSISFAASPQALVALPGVSRELNRVALADALCRRFPDVEETFFAAVRRLPSGCMIVVRGGAIAVHRYWDPFATARTLGSIHDHIQEQFEEWQTRAVRRCVDLGPSAIFLSGGLDSVGIATIAADVARQQAAAPPVALSMIFPDPECDERTVQTAVAQELGLFQHAQPFLDAVPPGGLLPEALALNRHLASPLLNLWAAPYQVLARAGARHGASSILTGIGGDEWMAASPYAMADFIRRGNFAGAARFAKAWNRAQDIDVLWQYGLRPLAGMMASMTAPRSWDRRRARRVAASDPLWIAPDPALRSAQLARAGHVLGEANPAHGFAVANTRANLTHVTPQRTMEEYFSLGMLGAVRFLHPYYDPDLIVGLCRVTIDGHNADGWQRGLSRRPLARRFPSLGFDRQRKLLATGFYTTLLTRELRTCDRSLLTLDTLSALGVVDRKNIQGFVTAGMGNPALAIRIWDLANVESWARQQQIR